MNSRKSKIFKAITLALNILLFLVLLLLSIIYFTSLEIKSQELKSLVTLSLITLPFAIIVWSIIRYSNFKKIVLNCLIPTILLIAILSAGPLPLLLQSSVFKTQSIYYVNIKNPNQKVEYQMQDMGAFGYNKRYVEATNYFGLFMKIKLIEQIEYDESEWKKVDINLNELNFP